MSFLFSMWTVAVFVIFCGIVVWAWHPKRKDEFARTARTALELDNEERNTGDG
jgi:cbb3-type cytochrome oxidase subunit 3